MTAPVYNSFLIGGMIPLLKRTVSLEHTHLLLHDYYIETFKRLGITRDEMLAITKAYTVTDPLVGTAILRYIDEDTSIKDDTKVVPLDLLHT